MPKSNPEGPYNLPVIGAIQGIVYNLGFQAGNKWADRPSKTDPTKTNGEIAFDLVINKFRGGHPLSKSFKNPVHERVRRGILETLQEKEITEPQFLEKLKNQSSN